MPTVAGPILPGGNGYPVVDDVYVRGGYKVVANATARDALPDSRRKAGMLVYVQEEQRLYRLEGQVGAWSWEDFDYADDGTSPALDNLAVLRALSVEGLATGAAVSVLGHTLVSDGGGGVFWWDALAVVADDNGASTVCPTGRTQAGRWRRVPQGDPVPQWGGGVPDLVITTEGHCTSAHAQQTLAACEACLLRYHRLHFPHGGWGLSRGMALFVAGRADNLVSETVHITAQPGTTIALVDAVLARKGDAAQGQVELPWWTAVWDHDVLFSYLPTSNTWLVSFSVDLQASGTIVTATTQTPHGLAVGDRIRVSWATDVRYNNNNTGVLVRSVPSPNSLTYEAYSAPSGYDTGVMVPTLPPMPHDCRLELHGARLHLNAVNRVTKYAADRTVIALPTRAVRWVGDGQVMRDARITGLGVARGGANSQPETFVVTMSMPSYLPRAGIFAYVPLGYTFPLPGNVVDVTVDTPEIFTVGRRLYQQGAGFVLVVNRTGNLIRLMSIHGPSGYPVNPFTLKAVGGDWAIIAPERESFRYFKGPMISGLHFEGPCAPQRADDWEMVVAITQVGTTATVTTTHPNGVTTGTQVTVAGASPPEYNGTFTVTRVSATAFRYTLPSAVGVNATGNVTARVENDNYKPELTLVLVAGSGSSNIYHGSLVDNVHAFGFPQNKAGSVGLQERDLRVIAPAGVDGFTVRNCSAREVGGAFIYADAHVALGVLVTGCRTKLTHQWVRLVAMDYGFQAGVDPHELKWHGPWWDWAFHDCEFEDAFCTGEKEAGVSMVWGSMLSMGYNNASVFPFVAPRPAYGQMANVERFRVLNCRLTGVDLPFMLSSNTGGWDMRELAFEGVTVDMRYTVTGLHSAHPPQGYMRCQNREFEEIGTIAYDVERTLATRTAESVDVAVPFWGLTKNRIYYHTPTVLPHRIHTISEVPQDGRLYLERLTLLSNPLAATTYSRVRKASHYRWTGGDVGFVLPDTEPSDHMKSVGYEKWGPYPTAYRLPDGEQFAILNVGTGVMSIEIITVTDPWATYFEIAQIAPGEQKVFIAESTLPNRYLVR